MNFLERIMVQHAHPTKLILELVGIIWGVYFLWQQNWVWAVILGLGLPTLGTILVWGKDEEQLAATLLGKVMLMHAHPMNFLLHIVGFIPLVYGLWTHLPIPILTGITVIVIAHLWGWERLK